MGCFEGRLCRDARRKADTIAPRSDGTLKVLLAALDALETVDVARASPPVLTRYLRGTHTREFRTRVSNRRPVRASEASVGEMRARRLACVVHVSNMTSAVITSRQRRVCAVAVLATCIGRWQSRCTLYAQRHGARRTRTWRSSADTHNLREKGLRARARDTAAK